MNIKLMESCIGIWLPTEFKFWSYKRPQVYSCSLTLSVKLLCENRDMSEDKCFKQKKSLLWMFNFNKEWTSKYFVTSVDLKSVCWICQESIEGYFPLSMQTRPQTYHEKKREEKKKPWNCVQLNCQAEYFYKVVDHPISSQS